MTADTSYRQQRCQHGSVDPLQCPECIELAGFSKRLEDSQNRNIDLLLCINRALAIVRARRSGETTAQQMFDEIEKVLMGKS